MTKEKWHDLLTVTELLGHSPEINQIRKSLPIMGPRSQHVMVIGDLGTEKLLVAKILFDHSTRTDDLLIITEADKLNSAYEHEIWRQALDQSENNPDKLVGTLVVQDVEHLDPEAQRKMLSAAKKGYFAPPDQDRQIETDFRLITTAVPEINEKSRDKSFLSELYLSLSELMIKLPAIKDRKQDIPLFFDYFLKQICQRLERDIPPVNFEIFNQMLRHEWQGNIKELENVVQSLVLSSPDGELKPELLPFFDFKEEFSQLELQTLGLAVARVEKELIEKALRRFGGNQSRAAQVLGISEPNMRFKMKKLGVRKEDFILGT